MMLPNLISVSVMPGCSAEAEVHAASDSRAASARLLDRIMDILPGGGRIIVAGFGTKAKPAPKNRSCVQLLDAPCRTHQGGALRMAMPGVARIYQRLNASSRPPNRGNVPPG